MLDWQVRGLELQVRHWRLKGEEVSWQSSTSTSGRLALLGLPTEGASAPGQRGCRLIAARAAARRALLFVPTAGHPAALCRTGRGLGRARRRVSGACAPKGGHVRWLHRLSQQTCHLFAQVCGGHWRHGITLGALRLQLCEYSRLSL